MRWVFGLVLATVLGQSSFSSAVGQPPPPLNLLRIAAPAGAGATANWFVEGSAYHDTTSQTYTFSAPLWHPESDEDYAIAPYSKEVETPPDAKTKLMAWGTATGGLNTSIGDAAANAIGQADASATAYYLNGWNNTFTISSTCNAGAVAKYAISNPNPNFDAQVIGDCRVEVEDIGMWAATRGASGDVTGPGIETFRCNYYGYLITYHIEYWKSAHEKHYEFEPDGIVGYSWSRNGSPISWMPNQENVEFDASAVATGGVGEPAGTHVGTLSGTCRGFARFNYRAVQL